MSVYQDIVASIIKDIKNGSLEKGSKLPSIRQLSQTYVCSKDTAQRALLDLKYQNYIYAVPKSGYYVLEGYNETDDKALLNLNDYNQLAYEDFKLCLDESLAGHQDYLFNYYHEQAGLKELVKALQNRLAADDIYVNSDQIVITSGSQQALYILSQIDFGNGGYKILIEQPTYHRMNQLINRQNLPYETITRNFDGLDFDKLEEHFKSGQIKFFYTISRYSNPLGLSYTAKEKEKLAQLASLYDVYIIEDDYMGDFSDSKNLPIHYYDTQNRVIYIKSFSMALFPGLRLGSVVLPPNLKATFLAHKGLIDYDTNLIMQRALSVYLDNGMFQKNIKKLRDLFQQTMEKSRESIENAKISTPYQISPRHITWQLPKGLSLEKFKAKKQIRFLESSFIRPTSETYLQIGHGQELESFIKLLKKTK
ncbi:aminotransferase-like domain-containing protein [Streptococcus salivarius]|jgi:DNA-binding transcriptional MocR family regulator|uniref:aminotransferase-like domain-containing protein n=1 Tax=Streptococcus salivarius TaxID=1304 RepID=UPI0015D2BAAA|nr:PLP-dependent aminotransferase family protein [Streptococcus salivarius]